MLVKVYKDSLLSHLEYNRRFQECCYLLGLMHNLKPTMTITEYWPIKEKDYFSWGDGIPQVKSVLDFSLKRICNVCNINESLDNFLLIFTCAKYGVWRTLRWIKQGSINGIKNPIEMIGTISVVKYLHSLILEADPPIRIDPLVEVYIHELYGFLKDMGWENCSEDELENLVKAGPSIALNALALVAANVKEAQELNNTQSDAAGKRNRETRRNHFFWRNRSRGITLKEIANMWEAAEEGYHVSENSVTQGIRSYKEKCGPLFETPSTINLLNHFTVVYGNIQDAAHRVFEVGMRNFNN